MRNTAVIRVIKEKNFTTMSNYHLRDSRLTLKAVGLLSKMLSLPEDWDYSVAGLTKICREGKDAITSAMKELQDCGYIRLNQLRGDGGTFTDVEYLIFESPPDFSDGTEAGYPEGETPQDISPYPDFPDTDKPDTDNPHPDNPPQLNTKLNNILNNNPPIAPRRRARAPKSIPEWEPECFEAFWKLYPRGEDRCGAVREWDRLKPDRALMKTMGAALKNQLNSDDWQRGIGIPYACRWLRKQRWLDEEKEMPEQKLSWAYDGEVGK